MLFLASGRLTAGVERLCREEQLAMSHYTVLWFLARRGEDEGVLMGAFIDWHLNRATGGRNCGVVYRMGLIVLGQALRAGRAGKPTRYLEVAA